MRLCSTQSHSRLYSLPEVQEFFYSQAPGPEDQPQALTFASAAIAGASEAAIMRQLFAQPLIIPLRRVAVPAGLPSTPDG